MNAYPGERAYERERHESERAAREEGLAKVHHGPVPVFHESKRPRDVARTWREVANMLRYAKNEVQPSLLGSRVILDRDDEYRAFLQETVEELERRIEIAKFSAKAELFCEALREYLDLLNIEVQPEELCQPK